MAVMVFLRPALGLALTMLAAPLYLHPLSLFGKSFSLAELVLLPTLVGWAVQLAGAGRRGREARGRTGLGLSATRRLLRPVAAFVMIAVLASLAAEHQREAFRELRLVVLEPSLLFLACATLPMDRRSKWRIVDAWVLSGLMVATVGLVQYLLLGDVITAEGGVERLRSLYGSPNNVGLYLGRLLPVMLAVVLWGDSAGAGTVGQRWFVGVRRWGRDLVRDGRRFAYLVGLAPLALALLLSLSRGAIVLGIPAALLAMGWMAGKRWRTATLVALALGIMVLIPLLQTPRFADMLNPTQGTTGFRVALWYSTLTLVRDRPLLGVGPDNYLYAYRTRYVLPTAWEEFNLSHPHNVLLDFAARLGLPGLAVFLWLQVAFWRSLAALRTRRRCSGWARALAIGMAGSMVDFLAHGMVDAAYFVIDLALVTMLSLSVVVWLSDGWLDG
jgi:O-antigen ligase